MLNAVQKAGLLSALMFFSWFNLVHPETFNAFNAEVKGIADGDTVAVVGNFGQEMLIRLAGIDAPEHAQAYGKESAANLSKLMSGKMVILECGGAESYGRQVCKVLLPNGEDVDLDQVKAGLAWHYKQYQDQQSPTDQKLYAAAEDAARKARLGLWRDPHPVQPQDFRHGTATRLCFTFADKRVLCAYQGPVRGNRASGIYHWPGCPNYDEIGFQNRVPFANAQAAEVAGYRAARNCP